ncbi:hypothetical protein EDB87DRAFT_1626822 [Lactarius vividus]|nr:hypothetical protein EDB87DRAFT_1626822 [Lactarius vividus]
MIAYLLSPRFAMQTFLLTFAYLSSSTCSTRGHNSCNKVDARHVHSQFHVRWVFIAVFRTMGEWGFGNSHH